MIFVIVNVVVLYCIVSLLVWRLCNVWTASRASRAHMQRVRAATAALFARQLCSGATGDGSYQ